MVINGKEQTPYALVDEVAVAEKESERERESPVLMHSSRCISFALALIFLQVLLLLWKILLKRTFLASCSHFRPFAHLCSCSCSVHSFAFPFISISSFYCGLILFWPKTVEMRFAFVFISTMASPHIWSTTIFVLKLLAIF